MKQMTLIEMDGFLKGKCIPRDLKINETNAEYLVRKFGELESKLETALRECRSAGITIDNLEAKCAALAVENAGLKAGIELASLESEAVAYIIQDAQARGRGRPGFLSFDASISDEDINEYEISVTPLYAAPQLPQPAVPDEMPAHIGPREFGGPQAYIDGWNDCRAAMLQSGNFRENKNSSTNYPVIPSEVLSAILKVAKIRADFDDFDGDRRGIGDCLDEAEQELIVTINKYASQLAAEPIATNDVREQTAVPPVPVIQADVAQAIEKLKRKLVECNRYNYCADAVKGVEYACHAAMLQGDEPVTDNTNQQFESLSRGDK